MAAPLALQTAFDSEVQPDLFVARYADLTPKNLPVAPLLVVEVLSPSTALHDRNTKKARTSSATSPTPRGARSRWRSHPPACWMALAPDGPRCWARSVFPALIGAYPRAGRGLVDHARSAIRRVRRDCGPAHRRRGGAGACTR
ncbi:MAG TPA: Uma2 family endonuclease [Pseudonocardia sp.]